MVDGGQGRVSGRSVDLAGVLLLVVVSRWDERLRSGCEIIVPYPRLLLSRGISVLMVGDRCLLLLGMQRLPISLLFVRLRLLVCVGCRLTLDGRVDGVSTSVRHGRLRGRCRVELAMGSWAEDVSG